MSPPRHPHLVQARREEAARVRRAQARAERAQAARPALPTPTRPAVKPAAKTPAKPCAKPGPKAAVSPGARPAAARPAKPVVQRTLRKPSARPDRPPASTPSRAPTRAPAKAPAKAVATPKRVALKPVAPGPAAKASRPGLPTATPKVQPPRDRVLPRSTPARPSKDPARPAPVRTTPKQPRPAPAASKAARTPPRPPRPALARTAAPASSRPVSRPPRGAEPQAKPRSTPPAPRPMAVKARAQRPALPSVRPKVALPGGRTPPPALKAQATPRARRSAAAMRFSGALGWLATGHGVLQDAQGASLRLLGLRSHGGEAATDLRDAEALLSGVAPGQRCLAVSLGLVRQLTPAALAALDERIQACAAAGIYTLLRIEARLWLHGHHLRLARRYAQEPAVLFALLGRRPLAARLWTASQALRAAHPRAMVWLPLESAHDALAAGAHQGLGWLWDAAHPQDPHTQLRAGALRQPVLLDGWQPAAHSPLAHDRLMGLCREAGIGWLAHSAGPWLTNERGTPVPSRAARVLQRALHLSGLGALP